MPMALGYRVGAGRVGEGGKPGFSCKNGGRSIRRYAVPTENRLIKATTRGRQGARDWH